jgi:UDP-N-acetylmuramate: L-alanyl-gamma-D-glutamyl-meso-diaminopimelate ligase
MDQASLERRPSDFQKIFFFRICGTGMGAAACLLKQRGKNVSGCDNAFFPPMSDYLRSTSIELFNTSEVDHEFLQQFDLIVVGNSVPRDSENARLIETSEVPYCSFPSALGAFVLKDIHVVGIAGTHGKTTTTYFASQVFQNLGVNVGHFIGGVIEGVPSSQFSSQANRSPEYFFIESDEYDCAYFEKFSKFQLYQMNCAIMTSLEFDHADIFNNIDEIKREFSQLLGQLDGEVVACSDYPELLNVLKQSGRSYITYGETAEAGPKNCQQTPLGRQFEICWRGETLIFETNIIGRHNIDNLASIILYALNRDFSPDSINEAIKNLELVKRRQEVRGLYQQALVIDDFAHHPTAVKVTINAIKEKYPNKKLWVAFDPISATARSNIFQDQFARSFSGADSIAVVRPSLQTTARGKDQLDTQKLVRDVACYEHIDAIEVSTLESLREEIDRQARADKILLILSNRTCLGLWESDFVNGLQPI